MTARDRRRQALDRARRSARAASRLLADPWSGRGDVLVTLAAGWAQLYRALAGGLDESGEITAARLRQLDLPGMGGKERSVIADTVPPLLASAKHHVGGSDDPLPTRKELRAHARRLRRIVRAAARTLEPGWRRWWTMAWRAAVVAAVVAAVAAAVPAVKDATSTGWRGLYYANRHFQGEPVVRRDRRVDFDWLDRGPLPEFRENKFSVRWDSCMYLPEATDLELRLGSDNGSRIYVDGERVIDNWGRHGLRWKSRTIELGPGDHHLRVEYFEFKKRARVSLEVREPGLPSEFVPSERFHAPGGPFDAADPCHLGRRTTPASE